MVRAVWGWLLMLALAAAMSGAASAEVVRLPKAGLPAFSFDAPDGWQAAYDDVGTLRLTAKDPGCSVILSIVTDPGQTPIDGVAATFLRGVGAAPYSSSSPGIIADTAGATYLTTRKNPSGVVVNLKLVLAKLDSLHYAAVVVLTGQNLSPATETALETLMARLRFADSNAPQK